MLCVFQDILYSPWGTGTILFINLMIEETMMCVYTHASLLGVDKAQYYGAIL